MILSVLKYFIGSTPDDFKPASKDHPFKACPDSPNCAIHSVEYSVSDEELFEATKSAMEKLSPFKITRGSQSHQTHAVFRIPVFGFKDDVHIIIQSISSDKTILYIKSASRVGESDLGVNRRRIKRIISAINQKLKL